MTPMNNKKAGIKFFASGNKVVALGFCIKQYHAIFVVSSTELQQIFLRKIPPAETIFLANWIKLWDNNFSFSKGVKCT